jgi:hypothetical protein
MEFSVEFGRSCASFHCADGQLVADGRRPPSTSGESPAELCGRALDQPSGGVFLRDMLTPDDRIAVVLASPCPGGVEIAEAVVRRLEGYGIPSARQTVVVPVGQGDVSVPGVTVETHEPAELDRLAYLATTADGRRVYLNRTIAEADAVVVIAEVRHDPRGGVTGGPSAVFPEFSDVPTREALSKLSTAGAFPEADEVSWLLGSPFFVGVVAGPGGAVGRVVAGLAPSHGDARKRLADDWVLQLDKPADLAVATLTGDRDRVTMSDYLTALIHASRSVRPGGAIALLTESGPDLPEVFRRLPDAGEAGAVRRRRKPERRTDRDADVWMGLVGRYRVYILSRWDEDQVESLSATPLLRAGEVQRLIDAADRVVILPDADRLVPVLSKRKGRS